MEQLINNLKNRLQAPLPGIDAQYRMAPVNREKPVDLGAAAVNYRQSAVMVLFCLNQAQQWYIPLIERMAYEGVHSAQISFPGGKKEQTDPNLQHTALRECEEEIGMSDIKLIGPLTKLYIPVSRFVVQPYIGVCLTPSPVFKPHPREVNRVLHLPVDQLLNDKMMGRGEVPVQNAMRMNVPYFSLENKIIWGATAMILSELKEVMQTIS